VFSEICCYLTVKVRPDWCVTDPDVAVTVTVYIPAGVPGGGGGGVDPPPHPTAQQFRTIEAPGQNLQA
jgi:hypothetical protein